MDPEKISIPLHPKNGNEEYSRILDTEAKLENKPEGGKDVESCLQYLEKLRQYQ